MYDLCQVLDHAKTPSEVFPTAKKKTGKMYTFWDPPETFSMGARINKGSSGVIYRGTFGTRTVAIKVNNPAAVKLRADADEVKMQSRLFCHVRDRAATFRGAAKIPDTFFATRIPRMGRALAMEQMDRSLLSQVQGLKHPDVQIRNLRSALERVAMLLKHLQKDLEFMHGDLHGENVMIRERPYEVYLIDFGMSSTRSDRGSRDITDERYKGVPFHPHLDFLTLLTALREDLSISGHEEASRWCDAFIRPYWETVRKGLFSGKVRAKIAYGAHSTVATAREELEESGEIYYAHHLLYEEVGGASYPPCSPASILRSLRSKRVQVAKKEAEWRTRIFEDA